jgi:hypothetical protein
MIRLKNDAKFVIILLIFIISVYFGYKSSNVMSIFLPRSVNIDKKTAETIFENAEHQRKITLNYNIADDKNIRNSISDLIFKEDVETKYADSKPEYQVYILEIPRKNIEANIKELRQLDGLIAEHINTDSEMKMDTNIKENLENQELTKKRIQELIAKTNSPQSLEKFHKDLENSQVKIDSLNNYVSIQERLMDHDLLYITSVNSHSTRVSAKMVIWKFVTTTISAMIFLAACLIAFYYIMVLFSFIMNAMGIKTSRESGKSSNYNYNYNKRSYGRKVKRIYKDADGKTIEKKDTK